MHFLKKGWPFVFAAIVVSIGAFIFGRAQKPPAPVPPEVIEDSERDLEWVQADREYMKKYWALHEEWKELSQEFKSLKPKNLAEFEYILSDPSRRARHRAKLKAWREKFEDWEKRDATLKAEKPVRRQSPRQQL